MLNDLTCFDYFQINYWSILIFDQTKVKYFCLAVSMFDIILYVDNPLKQCRNPNQILDW